MKRRSFLGTALHLAVAMVLPAPVAAADRAIRLAGEGGSLPMTVSQAAGGKKVTATAPCVTVGPRGHLFVAWGQGMGKLEQVPPGGLLIDDTFTGDIYYATTPMGDDFAWSQPLLLSDGDGMAAAPAGGGPTLRIDTLGYVYAAWTRRRGIHTEVMFARSGMDVSRPVYRAEDEGKSAVPPMAVGELSGTGPGFPTLAVDETGVIYIAWLDSPGGSPTLYVARSRDGARFETVEAGRGFVGSPSDLCRPALQPDGAGRLYLAFRGDVDDERDVWVTVSDDRGKSFGTPTRVSPDRWKLRHSPASGPALAVAMERQPMVAWWTGEFGVTTEADRPAPGGRILLAGSGSGGRSFSAPLLELHPKAATNHPALAAAGTNVVLAWEDAAHGTPVVRASYSDDGGRSFRSLRLGAHLPKGMRDLAEGDAVRGALPSVTLDANGDPVVAWSGPEENVLVAVR